MSMNRDRSTGYSQGGEENTDHRMHNNSWANWATGYSQSHQLGLSYWADWSTGRPEWKTDKMKQGRRTELASVESASTEALITSASYSTIKDASGNLRTTKTPWKPVLEQLSTITNEGEAGMVSEVLKACIVSEDVPMLANDLTMGDPSVNEAGGTELTLDQPSTFTYEGEIGMLSEAPEACVATEDVPISASDFTMKDAPVDLVGEICSELALEPLSAIANEGETGMPLEDPGARVAAEVGK
ncbi:hypothetical protein GYMLUDRAFT_250937 [Collybiopsis luxurians FD-317 M1]|uniref:Uncharacterized protein n=1 Tax=Collybiopsis luxurians FD-317 M1 TaxID=944289 RepID=A0A0D0BT82_9AGAR|nr:hypothetical protein GYMLUDRAFT_250937 [Collybiopsis luxurians FD-317 M1]